MNESQTGASTSFSSPQETAPFMAAIVDSDLCLRFLSDPLSAVLGLTAPAAVGRPLDEAVPELFAKLSPVLQQVRAGKPESVETEISLGALDWLATCRVQPATTGQATLSISLQPLTELRRARQELQDKATTLEILNHIGRSLTAELDIDNLVQTVTDAATEIAGAQFGAFFYNLVDSRGESYTLYTLSGAPREAFEKFPMPRNTEVFGPTFRGEGVICLANVRKDPRYGKMEPYHGMPEGHLPVTSYLAVPVVSRSGEVLGGLFFGHEDEGVFTEREAHILAGLAAQTAVAMDNARLFKSLQQNSALAEAARLEAEEASRAKDEFLAVVSHELRTPLTAMRGWLHLIRSGTLDNEAYEQALDALERSGRAQTQLIDDLLDVSRITLGKLSLSTEPMELPRLIREAIEIVRPAADARQIAIVPQLDEKAGRVQADAERLRQVIWNLLSNAVKFTPAGGRIDVFLECIDGTVQIRVRDNGSGIHPEFLPHVFERFRQADGTSTRNYNGLGLGLAIVRHLVEMHGGTVKAESDGPGTGATFTMSLPALPPSEAASAVAPARTAAADSSPLAGLRILIVENEDDARLLLNVMLTRQGAEIREADSVAYGFDIVQSWKPDLLVSDIGMPGEDGCSLIERIRALPPGAGGDTLAIALTAYTRPEDRTRILSAGFQIHIPKPIDLEELVASIAILARRK